MYEKSNNTFLNAVRIPLIGVALLWVIHLFNLAFNLYFLGIYPRTVTGLIGILTSPLIHSSFGHLASNSVPLFVLSVMMLYFYPKIAFRAFVMIYILTGIAVWMMARPAITIGASGVVYGLVTFIFWTGIFRRSLRSIILALIVTVLYSGMALGIIPDDSKPISWESHLLGALVGVFVAFYFRDYQEDNEQEEIVREEEEQVYFFPRDTFDRRKNDYQ